MARTTKVTCDACGGNLTSTSNERDYCLTLANTNIPSRGGFVTAMLAYPSLDREHHFCNTACLDHWSDRRRFAAKKWSEWYAAWKEAHGSRDGRGRFRSWPSPPADVEKAAGAEIDAAAMAAFPMQRPTDPAGE
jgi:hypothetical protein